MKKVFTLVLCILMVGILAGCGKGTYKVSPEWDKINNKVTGIQMGDIFFYSGMTYEQVVNTLKTSRIDYTYSGDRGVVTDIDKINKGVSVYPGGRYVILVNGEEGREFHLFFDNVWDEEKRLSQLPLYAASETLTTDKKFVKYMGVSHDEIMDLPYNDMEDAIEELFDEDLSIKVIENYRDDDDKVAYHCEFETASIEEMDWTETKQSMSLSITIRVSKSEKKVVDYEVDRYIWPF